VYECEQCGFVGHRDVVGASNILSRRLYVELGRVMRSRVRHRASSSLTREASVPSGRVACHNGYGATTKMVLQIYVSSDLITTAMFGIVREPKGCCGTYLCRSGVHADGGVCVACGRNVVKNLK
jgi:hypothetical protein